MFLPIQYNFLPICIAKFYMVFFDKLAFLKFIYMNRIYIFSILSYRFNLVNSYCKKIYIFYILFTYILLLVLFVTACPKIIHFFDIRRVRLSILFIFSTKISELNRYLFSCYFKLECHLFDILSFPV